jgi:hypothetical protein
METVNKQDAQQTGAVKGQIVSSEQEGITYA